MIYLKKFNESKSNLESVSKDCKDILLALSDKGIYYNIIPQKLTRYPKVTEIIDININSDNGSIKLKEYELEFEHLLSYLESEGFSLRKGSYYGSDDWDSFERCPKCDSQDITTNENKENLICKKCGTRGDYEDFSTLEYPLNKSELIWSIKKNDYPQYIYLTFGRDSK